MLFDSQSKVPLLPSEGGAMSEYYQKKCQGLPVKEIMLGGLQVWRESVNFVILKLHEKTEGTGFTVIYGGSWFDIK